MAVKYHVVMRKNPLNPEAPPTYHPSIRSERRITMNDLAEIIADGASLRPADVIAGLISLTWELPKILANGDVLELGDLGSFMLRIKTTGAASPEAVSPANIDSVLIRFIPGKRLKKALNQIEFVLDTESEPPNQA